jgi:diguanylate cyclase (GGDEF)-like protein
MSPPGADPVDTVAQIIGRQIQAGAGSERATPPADAPDDATTPPPAPGPPRPKHAYLLVLDGPRMGELYRLDRSETTIGRGPDAAIRLPEPEVSRAHARILTRESEYQIEDLGSRNGTARNGRRIESAEILEDGDLITFGAVTVLKFTAGDDDHRVFRERMLELGVRDPVTRTLKADYFHERLGTEFTFATRHGVPLALLVVDVDHFRHVNEIFGTDAGDHVLRDIAKLLRKEVRREDFVARLKDDKLVVLCRGTHLGAANALAERIRLRVIASHIRYEERDIPLTVCIGIAVAPGEACASPEDLVEAVLDAVAVAKRSGRNRTVTG